MAEVLFARKTDVDTNTTNIAAVGVEVDAIQATLNAADIVVGSVQSGLGAERVATTGTSITVDISGAGTIVFKRAALTGDVTASADSNATTIANDAVTFAKMQNIATDRLIGRDTAGSGDPEEITVGGGLEFTGSAGIQIANDGVTNARLADMAQSTIKGRASGAGTGNPIDLSASQVTDIVNVFSGDSGSGGGKGLVPAPAAGEGASNYFLHAGGLWQPLTIVVRTKLAANLTIYVRTDGNDSNTGLTDSAGGAKLTWQAAVDLAIDNYDFNNNTVIVQQGAQGGTPSYTAGVSLNESWVGGGMLHIKGDTTTPDNVRIATTSATAFDINDVILGVVRIEGFRVQTTTSGYGFRHQAQGLLEIGNIKFMNCASGFISAQYQGAKHKVFGTITLSGDTGIGFQTDMGESYYQCTVVLDGSRSVSDTLIDIRFGGFMYHEITWNTGAGSMSGKKFNLNTGGRIKMNSGGITTIPGDVAGTITSGAMFIGDTDFILGINAIRFPATAVANSDANTLDDYEEGTFTPAITINGAATTASSQVGTYTKTGNRVSFTALVTLTSNGAGSGSAKLTGLPFTAANNTPVMTVVDSTDAARSYMSYINGTEVLLRYSGAATTAATETQITDTSVVYVSGVYQI